ncbi:MAG: PIN domain-containing protein [Nocardioides sp.]|uniref:PIN domain-containing protein n=1 Tax=Nocardioides sp. TaxID=35761 RepID=UPI0039E6AB29
MATWYADTSAALKLVLEEAESPALAAAIDDAQATLVGTRLLETEMRRAAYRSPELDQTQVSAFLATIDLYSLTDALYRQAGLLPGANLRSLDALHLAAAIALGVDALLTYDLRMAEAAHELGLVVLAPDS